MFGKKSNEYQKGYDQARQDAAQELTDKMTELSMMNKKFAQTLIDTVRGK